MDFLENDLEGIIFKTDSNFLQERGLNLYGKKKRQLRIGNYGIADIVALDRWTVEEYHPYEKTIDGEWLYRYHQTPNIRVTVCELKKDKIDYLSLLQAIRYVKGIERYLSNVKQMHNTTFRIVLIGKSIDVGDFVYFTDFIDDIEGLQIDYYTYSYEVDGIYFKSRAGYHLTEEGF